jgi:FkbM family methyltransferase
MLLLQSMEKRHPAILERVSEFRRTKATESPDVYDMAFFEARSQNPWFGYIEIQNDGANPFFMLNNNDDIIAEFYLWYGANGYERTTIREWIRLVKSAAVVFDIGANTGIFSLLACFAGSGEQKVVAFEPTSRAHTRVLENCNVNNVLDRVTAEKMALSNRVGTLEFQHFENSARISSGASYIDGVSHFTVQSRELCVATTLDTYIAETGVVPDLLKIDVEGAEVHVMEGARNLIARRTATFIIEVIAQTVDDVLAHFEGYQLFVLNDHLNRVEPYAGNLDRHTNIMLVPR